MEWGTSIHRGMTDVMATIAATLPWDDAAAGLHIAWLLRVGEAWWREFSSLGEIERRQP